MLLNIWLRALSIGLCTPMLMGCVAYSDRVSYLFEAREAGWECGTGAAATCSYSCGAGSVRIEAPVSESSYEGIFIPMYRLSSRGYIVRMRVADRVMGPAKCTRDTVSLLGPDGVSIVPKEGSFRYHNSPDGFSGAFHCEFVFPVELLTQSTYTLQFGAEGFNCPIPDLHVNRTERSGFGIKKLQ